jgi:hypothetical protein
MALLVHLRARARRGAPPSPAGGAPGFGHSRASGDAREAAPRVLGRYGSWTDESLAAAACRRSESAEPQIGAASQWPAGAAASRRTGAHLGGGRPGTPWACTVSRSYAHGRGPDNPAPRKSAKKYPFLPTRAFAVASDAGRRAAQKSPVLSGTFRQRAASRGGILEAARLRLRRIGWAPRCDARCPTGEGHNPPPGSSTERVETGSNAIGDRPRVSGTQSDGSPGWVAIRTARAVHRRGRARLAHRWSGAVPFVPIGQRCPARLPGL